MQPDPPPQSIMIFLKHFDTSKQSLCGVGKTYMLRTAKVGDLAAVINERMLWTPGTPLKLYEVLNWHVAAQLLTLDMHRKSSQG
jgi:ubiquitin carboxyl-terminal hydrolase 7